MNYFTPSTALGGNLSIFHSWVRCVLQSCLRDTEVFFTSIFDLDSLCLVFLVYYIRSIHS